MTISENIVFVAKNLTGAAFQNMMADSMKAEKVVGGSFEEIQGQATKAGLAIGAFGAIGMAFVAKSTMLAARVETLGIVLHKVGQNAGYSTDELDEFERQTREAGITTQAARQSIVLMAQANLDLSKASTLARIAQDAAVIAGVNSSQAFERMIHAVTTLQPEVLRTLGIIVNLDQAYADYAEEMDVAATSIDGQTKQQIMMNAVMEEASKISGSYTSALDTAGKKVGSMDRLVEEASLTMGKIFLPAYNKAVDVVYQLLKAFNALDPALQTTVGELIAFSSVMLVATGGILGLAAKLPGLIGSLGVFGGAAQAAAGSLTVLPGILGRVTASIVGMQSAALAGAASLGVLSLAIAGIGIVLFGAYKLYQIHKREQQEYREELLKTADVLVLSTRNYEDYSAALDKVASKDGLRVDAEGNLIRMRRTRYQLDKEIIQENYRMVESEYAEIKAVKAAADAEIYRTWVLRERNEEQQQAIFSNELLEESLKKETFALRFARDEAEELIIAYQLYPDEISLANKATLEMERAQLVAAAATGELTEEERKRLELLVEGVDVKLNAISILEDLEKETQEAADAAREARLSYEGFFESINVQLPSPIKAFIEDLKWMIAGGAQYSAAFEAIKVALFEQQITPEEALAFSEELFVAVEQGLAEAGLQSKEDAAANIEEALGIPIEEAGVKLGEFETGLDAVASVTRELLFVIKVEDPYGILAGLTQGELRGMGIEGSPTSWTTIPAKEVPPLPGIHKDEGPQAMGGSYLVTRPTHFLAGEAGAEYAFFLPRTQAGSLTGRLHGSPLGDGRGQTLIYEDNTQIHNYDEGTAVLSLAIQSEKQRKRLNSYMGV